MAMLMQTLPSEIIGANPYPADTCPWNPCEYGARAARRIHRLFREYDYRHRLWPAVALPET